MANENQIWTGSVGEVWLNNTDKLLRVQKFTFKQSVKTEDVDDTDSFAVQKRVVGIELSGEITKYKVDFAFNDIFEKYKNKEQPTISLVAKVENPDTGETRRISINSIVFSDFDIFGFEKGKVTQDTLAFSAGNYEYLD